MKLWLQSGSGLTVDSTTPYGGLYEKSLERRLTAVVRSDTEFGIFGIRKFIFFENVRSGNFGFLVGVSLKAIVIQM